MLLQLKTQVGSPFEARKVFLSLTGTVTLELRQKDDPDPAKHQSRNNVDRWSYDGTKWKLKAPVVLLANEIPTLDAQMYDPTTLAWSKIPPLGAQALKVLDEIEKPKLGSIGVVGKGVSIRISVEGARGSGHLTADGRTGAVTELARD